MANTASGNKVTRIYSNFRGVDFRGDEINLMRSPDSLNMWKDYKETDSIRTRPALEGSYSFYNTIWGVFFYTDTKHGTERKLIHCGDKLLEDIDGRCLPKTHNNSTNYLDDYIAVNKAKSKAFIYDNNWYFKDGLKYYVYDGDVMKEVEGYVPTTSIGSSPSGGGRKAHEDVNLLTGRRINTFLADGKSFDFHLDTTNIDKDFEPVIYVNGLNTGFEYSVNEEEGIVTIYSPVYDENGEKTEEKNAISSVYTDGQDNISIEFSKTIEGYREKIDECTLLEVFDNRVFFSGNSKYPNYVWHCSLDNPAYCSDLDYYIEGLDTARVTGLVAGNNALWVFKEPSQSNTSIYYHTPAMEGSYGKVYPSTHSNISLGCVGGAINFNDDIVFFSQRGMEGVHADIDTEQAVSHRSSLVDRKLLAEADYKNMVLVEWEGYLLCFVGNKAYLADSRATFSNENHFEYEWFYWEFDVNITCAIVNDGILYVGAKDSNGKSQVYSFTDSKSAVESYWVTPKDKFKYPQRMKTTNKRGCTVDAKTLSKDGSITIYAKTDKNESFTDGTDGTDNTLINTYTNVGDYFVSRIKRKKFKDIQLKFYSETRFSLESATLECYIGGYIKR